MTEESMNYQMTDELIRKRLKPIEDSLAKSQDVQYKILHNTTKINGTVKRHEKSINKLDDYVKEETEIDKQCPIRNNHVDVVTIQRETRWSRWLGNNRYFIFLIAFIIAMLAGVPNWLAYFGITHTTSSEQPVVEKIYIVPEDTPIEEFIPQ